MTKEMRDIAEGELIDVVRRNDVQNFILTITCQEGRWTVTVVDLDVPKTTPRSDMLRGTGDTFAEAWTGQEPTWAKEAT